MFTGHALRFGCVTRVTVRERNKRRRLLDSLRVTLGSCGRRLLRSMPAQLGLNRLTGEWMSAQDVENLKALGGRLDRAMDVEVESRKAERTRLVWYVGISGYVLVNAQGYWKTLVGHELQGHELLWLSI